MDHAGIALDSAEDCVGHCLALHWTGRNHVHHGTSTSLVFPIVWLSAFLSFVIEQQSSSGITIVSLEARLRTLKMVFLHGAKVQKELSSSFAGSSRAEVEEDADIFEAFFQ